VKGVVPVAIVKMKKDQEFTKRCRKRKRMILKKNIHGFIFIYYIFLMIFLFISSGITFAQDRSDFRKVRWGMSKVEVMASEEMKPLAVEDKYISYKFDLWGKEVFLLYDFVDNTLFSARYVYSFPSEAEILKIKSIMKSKYGSPLDEGPKRLSWKSKYMFISMEYSGINLRVIYKSTVFEKLKVQDEVKLKKEEEANLRFIF